MHSQLLGISRFLIQRQVGPRRQCVVLAKQHPGVMTAPVCPGLDGTGEVDEHSFADRTHRGLVDVEIVNQVVQIIETRRDITGAAIEDDIERVLVVESQMFLAVEQRIQGLLSDVAGLPFGDIDEQYTAVKVLGMLQSQRGNPASVAAALQSLQARNTTGGRRIAVLGDMLELGDGAPGYHTDLVRHLNGIDGVYCVGPLMRHLFEVLPAGKGLGWHDDPVTLKTKHGPIVALPYTFEVHDIVMMNLQHLPSEAFHARAMDHFGCLYAESAERAKIMAISCHPYLSGVPHRIGHVERTFADILAHDGVVAWDGARIIDWYKGQTAVG